MTLYQGRRVEATTLLAACFVLTFWLTPVPCLDATSEQASTKAGRIPDEHAVTITGRVLSKEKKPVVGLRVIVSETTPDPAKITTSEQIAADGTILNPNGKTDSDGRFTIRADRRFWGKTGYFTIEGSLQGTGSVGILRNATGGFVLIRADSKAKKIELGEITSSQ